MSGIVKTLDALERPQAHCAAEFVALFPAILDHAFMGEL